MASSGATRADILVIDDDEATRSLLCDVLEDQDYRPYPYGGAFETPDDVVRLQPDLIVLDIVLGDKSVGLTFIEVLKDDPHTRHIPLLVCTAAKHLTDEIQAQLTARDCLIIDKPFDLESLLAEVRRCLDSIARKALPV